MSYEIDNIYVQNNLLPFFRVANTIVNFLKVQPYLAEFNDAIYNYRREDNPNIALPALFVYPTAIRTKGFGFFMESIIRVEIVRNMGKNNRGAIYSFSEGILERVILNLCDNQEFLARNLNSYAPYIVQFGDKFGTSSDTAKGISTLSILCKAHVPTYNKWAASYNFVPSGNDGNRMTVVPNGLTVSQEGKDPKDLIGD